MMRQLQILLASLLIGMFLAALVMAQPSPDAVGSNSVWGAIQKTIEKYLGRPYALGAVGQKSFDCSGFVWRIMAENGIMMKRTTARKLYMSLPGQGKDSSYAAGSLVFFDQMKHVGIVKDRESFYHAQVSKGTNLSEFDPYWRRKIYGFKKIPI
jgi:cell wall-associated NlpC family hydrolase